MVHPVILAGGVPLLGRLSTSRPLQLLRCTTFASSVLKYKI
jgi:hypothetical protein